MDGDYENEVANAVADGFNKLTRAITPLSAMAGRDAAGGRVESLTEAVMGLTAGLVLIADSISDLAEAVRERDA
jgi:hypothetical protein